MQTIKYFRCILTSSHHILLTFLNEKSIVLYYLRNRSHNKNLLPKSDILSECDFLVHMLYKDR